MLYNGAFLLIIILGNGLYFGRKIFDINHSFRYDKFVQNNGGKGSRNIEKSFLDMTLGVGDDKTGTTGTTTGTTTGLNTGESEEELLSALVLLVGMLKKAHTPEAKIRLCHDKISQWREMLILLSDDLANTVPIVSPYVVYADVNNDNNHNNAEKGVICNL